MSIRAAFAQTAPRSCEQLTKFKLIGTDLVIAKAESTPAAAALPAYCRVDGTIDPRTGVGDKPDGIGFAIALPANWNGGFLFQGGGGLNGSVARPLGWQAAGDTPALCRAGRTRDRSGRGRKSVFLVPGMGHCQGGTSTLDHFDALSAVVDWVEKGVAPDSITATGKAFLGRSRPLCAWPKYTWYNGKGDGEDAKNFECRE